MDKLRRFLNKWLVCSLVGHKYVVYNLFSPRSRRTNHTCCIRCSDDYNKITF
jgi:hypothetical protein